jgi:hypothetical protein
VSPHTQNTEIGLHKPIQQPVQQPTHPKLLLLHRCSKMACPLVGLHTSCC